MTKRNAQRGSAMLVTMIVISSLLAGAAVLVSMQLASNRSSDLTRTGLEATYCAEAGLDAARSVVAANFSNWAASLAACGSGPYPCAEPAWLSSALGNQNLSGGSGSDYWVYIKDNDDELRHWRTTRKSTTTCACSWSRAASSTPTRSKRSRS